MTGISLPAVGELYMCGLFICWHDNKIDMRRENITKDVTIPAKNEDLHV